MPTYCWRLQTLAIKREHLEMNAESSEHDIQWILDPAAAAQYSRTHARRIDPECKHVPILCHCDPTDWTRCEYVTTDLLETIRCGGGIGHLTPHTKPRSR